MKTEDHETRLPLEELYHLARQYSRRAEEVDDLVQDLLLEAIRKEWDFTTPEFMRWARGVLRNHAAFVARTEGRRRKREKDFLKQKEDNPGGSRVRFPGDFMTTLRPSLRTVARLINCGMNREETAYLLAVSDTALRQRFTALRRAWKLYLEAGGEGPEYTEEANSPFHNGLIRRSLRQSFRESPGRTFGSHDPDGHLLIVRSSSAHKKSGGGNRNKRRE